MEPDRTDWVRWMAAASVAAGTLACAPTYAPPIRTVLMGAPGTARDGQIELAGAAGGSTIPFFGDGVIAVHVPDAVTVEIGGGAARGLSLIGFAGVRYLPVDVDLGAARLSLDLEAGGGLGAGGVVCGNQLNEEGAGPDCCGDQCWDGLEWYERLGGGAYAGLGLASHFDWFALYLRTRWQVTAAELVPWTVWGTFVLGFQFDILETAALHFAGGGFYMEGEADSLLYWLYEMGLTFRFDAFGEGSPDSDDAEPPSRPILEPTDRGL